MDINTIPKDYRIRLTLCNEKGSAIGEAMIGLDMINAMQEHAGESALDYNLNILWKQYLDGVMPHEREALLKRSEEKNKDKEQE